MKCFNLLRSIPLVTLLAGCGWRAEEAEAAPFAYENNRDLVTAADFDGNGLEDVVIVEKQTGKYRLGYQQAGGFFDWVRFRQCGTEYVTGLAVGRFLAPDKLAVAFASSDSSAVMVCDVSDPKVAGVPVPVSMLALGPHVAVAVPGAQGLQGMLVGSIYNGDPTPNRLTWVRYEDELFLEEAETPLPGTPRRANRVRLKADGPELVGMILGGEEGDLFRVDAVKEGQLETMASATRLPVGSQFVTGQFRRGELRDFLFYAPGENTLHYRPVEEPGAGQFRLGSGQAFPLEQPIKQVFSVAKGAGSALLILFGEGETAGVYDFDGSKAPALAQSVTNRTGEVFFGAIPYRDGFVMYAAQRGMRVSSRYYMHHLEQGAWVAGRYGALATLEATDEMTVPKIQELILKNLTAKSQAEMKPYTNTIPGTDVTYVMVPIPGGEFLMGTPESEPGRKPDEGPQHKVKLAPFWMGQFEITWNEYELFMYPEDEKKLRDRYPTEEYLNKVSDAVSRPSKPYVEMSFGMGKNGFPAIAMTHHGAAKYCQWLSAKTGHFYRLPTEAEWEYACRAGTTTAYSFGDDPKQVGDYAWYGMNSDWKYQKVGKKKPNPWGLYDMHGNVLEWCLDQYDPDYYKQFADSVAIAPWNKATKPYPHCARGGSWDDDDPAVLRSGARRGSDRAWKATDPQLPKSVWWLSDAQFIGFRIIRPLEVPGPEALAKYWITGTEKD